MPVPAEGLRHNLQIPKQSVPSLLSCYRSLPALLQRSFGGSVSMGHSSPASCASEELDFPLHTRSFKLAAWVGESAVAGSCPPQGPCRDLLRFPTSFLRLLVVG